MRLRSSVVGSRLSGHTEVTSSCSRSWTRRSRDKWYSAQDKVLDVWQENQRTFRLDRDRNRETDGLRTCSRNFKVLRRAFSDSFAQKSREKQQTMFGQMWSLNKPRRHLGMQLHLQPAVVPWGQTDLHAARLARRAVPDDSC